MSKAVEKAYKAYPLTKDNRLNHERNAKRLGFQQGYEQAEKDLELTIEDIKTIDKLLNQCVDCNNPYQEVLKRFKAQKVDIVMDE